MKREEGLFWTSDNDKWRFAICGRAWALPLHLSFFGGFGIEFLCIGLWYVK